MSRMQKSLCRVLALLVVPAVLAGGTVVSPAAAPAPIVIGGTLGLTGAFSGPSAEMKAVYDWWLDRVNSQGGLLDRPVKMIIYNDESTPTTAQSLYQRLINVDKVDLLLAPYTTFVGGAVVPIALTSGKLLFNGGFVGFEIFTNARGSIIGSYTYQEPDYTRGIFELIKTLPQDKRPSRVGIVTNQNPFTLVVRDGFRGQGGALSFAKEAGMQVVFSEQYPASTVDFSGLVDRAKAANVDLFFVLGLPNDTLQIVRTAHQRGLKPKIMCVCGSQVSTLPAWPGLGGSAEGVTGTTTAWPTQKNPGMAELAEFVKKRGLPQVATYHAVPFTILQVLEQAVQGAKTLDQPKLKEYILTSSFRTVSGTIRFQPNGTPTYNQIILQWLNGKNEVVWPPKERTRELVAPMR